MMADDEMTPDTLDRRRPARVDPDPWGEAALTLTESLLHTLLETGALTPAQALDTVRTAVDVRLDAAEEAGEGRAGALRSLVLLQQIEGSLSAVKGAPTTG